MLEQGPDSWCPSEAGGDVQGATEQMMNLACVWGPGWCLDGDTGAASLYKLGVVVEEGDKDEVVHQVHHYLLHVHFFSVCRVQYVEDTLQMVLNHRLELYNTFLGEGDGKSLSFDAVNVSILSVGYVEMS